MAETKQAPETLEEIADRIAGEWFEDEDQSAGALVDAIVSALRNERERAVRIIDEHQAMDVCKDNCWTTIKAAIRKGE